MTVSLLAFPSGVKAHIFVSWLHPFKEQKLVVVGEKQMAVFDDTEPWEQKLALYPHRVQWHGNLPEAVKAEAIYVDIPQYEPLRAECEHFISCIRDRSAPLTDGEEGLRVLKVLNACKRAIEHGRPVALSKMSPRNRVYVHPTAVVDNGVTIGHGTKIWHFSHILKGSEIVDQCNIGHNVIIGPRVKIGKGSKIQTKIPA